MSDQQERPWSVGSKTIGRAAWDALALPEPQAQAALTRLKHGYEGLIAGLGSGSNPGQFYSPFAGNGGYQQLSQPETWISNMAASPFTLQMMALNFGYMTYGLAQTLIDQPVDDAFKGGLIIKIPEMQAPDIARLHKRMKKMRAIASIKQGIKWARLFGGGGLIIVTDQDPTLPLDSEALANEGSALSFLPFDRWEVTTPRISTNGFAYPTPYLYYNETLDYSRVIRIMGRPAPSRVRPLLQGWGMSELERCIREIQSYIKFQTVVYELVDEGKIDVYRLEELNNMLDSAKGTQAAILRVTMANLIKNYKNAVVLDKEDEYEQKTMAFSGLAEICEQFRINLAGALRIPVNKLFGQSATGFSSGEDAMENYNALVESDIREPNGPLIDDVISLCCFQEFGYVPEFTVEFHPLRIVNPVEEEQIKTSKQARTIGLRQAGQITPQEADNVLHQEGLLSIETEVGNGADPQQMWPDEEGAGDQPGDEVATTGGKKKNAIEPGSPEDHRQKYNWLKAEAKKGNFGAWWRSQAKNGEARAEHRGYERGLAAGKKAAA
jgi:phage-related protein (TIGR01555 family)